ncbi:P-loop containing nucleoside triphosphate hydrolase protein [Dunaliella salina]|uniref:P-loop containing nucleoside triphosphate hydrolase protein n=1 Tax=Dunaliella salina TaxID=3046 RepID=A0ABQ7GRD4_DUNSA|nr:P-loop containing nucleoside triphosphate hydrolase protein [Dunaliella salina]|eukprot:KAF5837172.1 P-loop containing nucleoside triphosphate hydrolase protein [Dunaliella salina]
MKALAGRWTKDQVGRGAAWRHHHAILPFRNLPLQQWSRRCFLTRATGKDEDDDSNPDWDKEMSIFNKRISAPNQLETLRELEGSVNVGKVVYMRDNVAILSGLNSDAPFGTKISFVTGGTGVLLWHRSENLAFALILGGAADITLGTHASCIIKGVLQVVDEVHGPVTKKEFELFESPAGADAFGSVRDFLGIAKIPGAAEVSQGACRPDMGKPLPLLNQQVTMMNREQVTEPLLTGVKALDVLTPVGRGSTMLVIGRRGSGKAALVEDAILGQRGTGVCVVLASVNRSHEELLALAARLEAAGALGHTAIVSSEPDAPLGKKFATLCSAYSIGERVRDNGGHSLVILDDFSPLANAWGTLALQGLGSLGQEVLHCPFQSRSFFSTLFLRAAKMSRSRGGGSLSALVVVPGSPATGQAKRIDMDKYQTLSEEQKTKIKAALEKKMAEEQATQDNQLAEGEIPTELVEEYISIADGQLVLDPPLSSPNSHSAAYRPNSRLSITRIGNRAYPKALDNLANKIRLSLVQADDARKFSASMDAGTAKEEAKSQRLEAALLQQPGKPASLEEQVVTLLAVQSGFTDNISPDSMASFAAQAFAYVKAAAPQALEEVRSTQMLTATAEKGILDALANLQSSTKQTA